MRAEHPCSALISSRRGDERAGLLFDSGRLLLPFSERILPAVDLCRPVGVLRICR
jgi:hypothetical protein